MTRRVHPDRCPGVLRPWLAADGALVRLRIPGGRIAPATLLRLVALAERYGDGAVLLTKRANLQLRGIAAVAGTVPAPLVADVTGAGLLPSRSHELVRNVVASPLTGLRGGRTDLRPVVAALDHALCADPALAALGGRFLFVLDDGRGDVAGRDLDLGLCALDATRVQLRAGRQHWGPVVPVADAPAALVGLARRFLAVRGDGPTVPWHVGELPTGGAALLDRPGDRHPAVVDAGPPAEPGRYRADDGRRLDVLGVPDGLVRRPLAERLRDAAELVVTPWRSIVVAGTDVARPAGTSAGCVGTEAFGIGGAGADGRAGTHGGGMDEAGTAARGVAGAGGDAAVTRGGRGPGATRGVVNVGGEGAGWAR